MTGFQDRGSRTGQAISFSSALREGMDEKEGGKSQCYRRENNGFDFCQVHIRQLPRYIGFGSDLSVLISIPKKFNQTWRKLLTASLIIRRCLAEGDSGWKVWGWGKSAQESEA